MEANERAMATKALKKTVTTNDLMDVLQDMMQMTSDGFGRLEVRIDRIENRMNGIESRMDSMEDRMSTMEGHLDRIERELQTIKSKLLHHDIQLIDLRRIAQELTDKHSAYINDIADLLERVTALEKNMPHVTKEELYELQVMLKRLVDWALRAAKTVKVPLKLP
jgi:chromosome segregation ATPase